MARYQPPGGRGRGPEQNRAPSARQLPPPDPAVRQRALAAVMLGLLGLIGLALGLGNLRRGIFVAVLTLLFGAIAIWLGVSANRSARRAGTARPRGAPARAGPAPGWCSAGSAWRSARSGCSSWRCSGPS